MRQYPIEPEKMAAKINVDKTWIEASALANLPPADYDKCIHLVDTFKKMAVDGEIIRAAISVTGGVGPIQSFISGDNGEYSRDYFFFATDARLIRFSLDYNGIVNKRIRSIPYDSIVALKHNAETLGRSHLIIQTSLSRDTYGVKKVEPALDKMLLIFSNTIKTNSIGSGDVCPRCFKIVGANSNACEACGLRFIDPTFVFTYLLLLPGHLFFTLNQFYFCAAELFFHAVWLYFFISHWLGWSGSIVPKPLLVIIYALVLFFIKLFFYVLTIEVVAEEKFVRPRQMS